MRKGQKPRVAAGAGLWLPAAALPPGWDSCFHVQESCKAHAAWLSEASLRAPGHHDAWANLSVGLSSCSGGGVGGVQEQTDCMELTLMSPELLVVESRCRSQHPIGWLQPLPAQHRGRSGYCQVSICNGTFTPNSSEAK